MGTRMRTRRLLFLSVVASAFIGGRPLFAAKPADFSTEQVGGIWTELWQSGDPNIREPTIQKLSEHSIVEFHR